MSKNKNNVEDQYFDESEETINIRQILEQYLYYWKWFVFGVIISLTLAFLYVKYTQKQYQVSAKILLNEKESATGELAGLMDQAMLGGGSGGSAEVGDQIDVLKSRRLLTKVIQKNNFNIQYFSIGRVAEIQLQQEKSPVKFILLNENDKTNESLDNNSFIVSILSNTKFKLENKKTSVIKEYSFGQKITEDFGSFIISPNGSLGKHIGFEYQINVNSIDRIVNTYQNSLSISPNTEKSSKIINFSLVGPVPDISKKLINDLITTYNEDLVSDNHKLTEATSKFIDDRLQIVTNDLRGVDKNLERYKVQNNITDVTSEANIFLESAADNEKKLLESSTQLQLVDYMNSALNSSKTDLLPSNIGLEDKSISAEISSYNELVLAKEDMLKSVTKDHPNAIKLQEQINDVKRNLKNSLRLYRNNTQTMLNSVQSKQNQIASRIQKVPSQERGFRDISRQQQIVEALYLFLLQKREENEIKAAATPDNIKVIDYAYDSKIPVSPKKSIILLGALILGLVIPFICIYIYKLLNNNVNSKEDVEDAVGAPIAGQVPKSDISIIEQNDNSSVAEAFRILRTNMNFLLKNSTDPQSIYITSTTSGEGKTFISTNLAQILTMSGKSVLLIGADIRSPKVLDYLGITDQYRHKYGVTEYLISNDINISDIIIKNPADYKFDVIYSGQVAPNPSELLMNGRFDDIVKYGKANYDYVLIDTAPVSLVTDTLLISDSADITMYVVRANYLDKRMLAIPKELYQDNRLKNMAMVVNDVDFTKGYGYGYGYGENHNKGNSFFSKLFGKK
ncbi:polysaccharide biosynthesis tyrosine autokinase [Empedobacter sp. GD03644]|uniref:GumC family protein n=1 Tax=Empedobacter sp. GD03644 TaxID=2975358 RepID=UPI002447E507|nr:polysaccharide biosynthesis tyrosine autokinase [Empedobacter sp. GD03644]MDH2207900.1 polysaccharide biosynthesis tyrosine autokinase [Empedobacter sp. GD03644]